MAGSGGHKAAEADDRSKFGAGLFQLGATASGPVRFDSDVDKVVNCKGG